MISELCTPIYKVTGHKSEWFWGPSQDEFFQKVKVELSKQLVLCSFDMNASHRVSPNAIKNAIGAVLLQIDNQGNAQPVEYASKKRRTQNSGTP